MSDDRPPRTGMVAAMRMMGSVHERDVLRQEIERRVVRAARALLSTYEARYGVEEEGSW